MRKHLSIKGAHFAPLIGLSGSRSGSDNIAYERLRKQILIKGASFAPSIGLPGSRSGSGNIAEMIYSSRIFITSAFHYPIRMEIKEVSVFGKTIRERLRKMNTMEKTGIFTICLIKGLDDETTSGKGQI